MRDVGQTGTPTASPDVGGYTQLLAHWTSIQIPQWATMLVIHESSAVKEFGLVQCASLNKSINLPSLVQYTIKYRE